MNWKFNTDTPIYSQITKYLEDDIFTGLYPEESQVPSTTETSITYNLNPATVLRGYSTLAEEGLIYKKRGIGMFVSKGALKKIKKKRQKEFSENFIEPMLNEAIKLSLSDDEILENIKEKLNETRNK